MNIGIDKTQLNHLHDKSIIGFLYQQDQERLAIYLKDNQQIIFTDVVFFEFSEVAMQNIIFTINALSYGELTADLFLLFPSLSSFKNRDELIYFHFLCSAGGELIVACHHKKLCQKYPALFQISKG